MNTKDFIILDEYVELVPRLKSGERRTLKNSIEHDHQQLPIVVNEKGVILDGHTRYEICQELQLKPKFIVKKFKNKFEETKFVIMSNIARRQLTKFSKIELAWEIYEIEKQRARKREYWKQWTDTPPKKEGNAMEIFGKYMDTGHTVIHQVEWLRNNASKPILIKLRSGQMSITRAYDFTRGINLMKKGSQHWFCKCGQANSMNRKKCLNCNKPKTDELPNYCPECHTKTEVPGEDGNKECHVHKQLCCTRCTWGMF